MQGEWYVGVAAHLDVFLEPPAGMGSVNVGTFGRDLSQAKWRPHKALARPESAQHPARGRASLREVDGRSRRTKSASLLEWDSSGQMCNGATRFPKIGPWRPSEMDPLNTLVNLASFCRLRDL